MVLQFMKKETNTTPKKFLNEKKASIIIKNIRKGERQKIALSYKISYSTIKSVLYGDRPISEKTKPCIEELYRKAKQVQSIMNQEV